MLLLKERESKDSPQCKKLLCPLPHWFASLLLSYLISCACFEHKILCWNITGLNAEGKWDSLRNKISKCNCDIISIQETKRSSFDLSYIHKFCPRSFDAFCFLPSVGASGGILVAWRSCFFSGLEIFQNNFTISVEFTSLLNNNTWILTSVYGPYDLVGKSTFMEWFENIQMSDDVHWLVVGDFNLIRKPEDRNRPGGNTSEMLLFNNAISSLGLVEIPLHGRKFTWTNKQHSPFLERLDWFLSSQSWTSSYPHTLAHSGHGDIWPLALCH